MIVFGSKASNDASSGRGSWPKRRAAPQSSWGVRKVVRGSRGGGRSWRRGASGWSSQVPGEFAKRSLVSKLIHCRGNSPRKLHQVVF